MSKVAIVSLGYLWFPCEAGTSRFFQIANTFVQRGYEVETITTSFQHFKKIPRDQKLILEQGYPFKITFIETPPYKKNVDPKRVLSNVRAARNLKIYLKQHIKEYDAVYVSIPANNIAAVVTEICKANQVPCVVDIEDLWPEAMSMIVKNKTLRDIIFHSFTVDAEKAYANADGVIGTSEDYTARAFKRQQRVIPKDTVYVGCDLSVFDEGVRQYKTEIEKPDEEFWITYAGSISTSYDIRTLVLAAEELLKKGEKDIRIQILGTGSVKDELETLVKDRNITNVKFWGFTPYPKMAAVLDASDVVINSFVKGAPQSIVNKVGDYLASGHPMINTLENPVFCDLINKYQVGINIEPENVEALADVILKLKKDAEGMAMMGANARHLAETEFDRGTSYERIVNMVASLITNKENKNESI